MRLRSISRIIVTLLLVMAMLALGGCRVAENLGIETPTTKPGVVSEPGQVAEPGVENDDEGLALLTYGEPFLEISTKLFTAASGVEIIFSESSNAAYETMLLDFAAGKHTYDILNIGNALGNLYTADSLLDRGYYAPLQSSQYLTESVSQMLPVLKDCVTRDGVIYALPYMVRTKVLTYSWDLYSGHSERLSFDTGEDAEEAEERLQRKIEQYPEQKEYGTWEELLALGLNVSGGSYAGNAMLEQYILSADQPGFSFNTPEFIQLLELIQQAESLNGNPETAPVKINIGNGVLVLRDEDGSVLSWFSDSVYTLPTVDPQGRLPMAYQVLAINAFTDKTEQAIAFLETAAEHTRSGFPDEVIQSPTERYGMSEMATCYMDADHVFMLAGPDEENQQRWLDITERLTPITQTGFLTSFLIEIYPMYRDGAISVEQCARMTQERYEMFRLEQGV